MSRDVPSIAISVSAAYVNDREDSLAAHVTSETLRRQGCSATQNKIRGNSNMRRDDHVRHAPQGLTWRQWLRIGDIQCRTSQTASLQGAHEVGRNQTFAASDGG